MKKNIIQTICITSVSLFALLASAGSVFAQPILAPVAVTNITADSATLGGYVTNTGRNSVVWFEWSEGSSQAAPSIVARKSLYSEGDFNWTLRDLTPGVVYSYRAAAMDGGVIVYTPTGSFKTPIKTNTGSPQIVYQNGQTNTALGSVPYNQTTAQNTNTNTTHIPTQQASPNINSNTTTVVEKKNIQATTENTDGFTNKNAASVGSLGGGVLPETLIGWVLLLIAILVMVLVAVMIYEGIEKRRLAIDERRKEKRNESDEEEEEETGK